MNAHTQPARLSRALCSGRIWPHSLPALSATAAVAGWQASGVVLPVAAGDLLRLPPAAEGGMTMQLAAAAAGIAALLVGGTIFRHVPRWIGYSRSRTCDPARDAIAVASADAGPRSTEARRARVDGAAAQADDGEVPGGSETVLIVDDEPDMLELAELMLSELGYRTVTARDGREAMRVLADDTLEVDLVFSDVVMPGGVNGFALARYVAERRPDCSVLLASGYTRTFEPAGDLRAILPKPYRRIDLARSVRSALDSKGP